MKIGTSVVLLALAAVLPGAATASCNASAPIQSRCPSGCTVTTTTYYTPLSGGDTCMKNTGATVSCPSPCSGEYVYTASVAGDCDTSRNVCTWWVRSIEPLMKRHNRLERTLFAAKAWALDCQGQLQPLLPYVRIAKSIVAQNVTP